jgi:hypothetical protein
MILDELFAEPSEPLGHVILESCPFTEKQASAWLSMLAACVPVDEIASYIWVPNNEVN